MFKTIRWTKLVIFLLSKSVEALILKSHLGLRSSSGSSDLSLTRGPICMRRSQRPCLAVASLGSAAEVFPLWWPSFLQTGHWWESIHHGLNHHAWTRDQVTFHGYRTSQEFLHCPLKPHWPWRTRVKIVSLQIPLPPYSTDFSVVVECLGQLLQSRLLTTV